MSAAHEAFLKAPPQNRWTRGFQPLFNQLVGLARSHKLTRDEIETDVFPAWYVLPGGCLVAMRELRDSGGHRFELRFARGEPLENEQKWQVEVETFLRHFEIRVVDGGTPCKIPANEWIKGKPGPKDAGRTAARFVSLLHGEIQPGKAQCAMCFDADGTTTVVSWWAPGGIAGQRCDHHAHNRPGPVPVPAQGELL